jgi:putative oxidoreductase
MFTRPDTPDRMAPRGALVLRLGLGAVFLAHALAKPLLFTLPGTVAYFEQNGFPGWSAYPVFAAELVGGLLLVLGVGTRIVATALVPVTVGAMLVHLPNGWLFLNPGGGWEYPAFLIAGLAAQALLGAGAYALHVTQLSAFLRRSRPADRVVPVGAPSRFSFGRLTTRSQNYLD